MSNFQLKPCPFCGSEDSEFALLRDYNYLTLIGCRKCKSFGPQVDIREYSSKANAKLAAVEAWNSRPEFHVNNNPADLGGK